MWKGSICIVNVDCYDYKSSLKDEIENSDLVISHAGAGTCLEVLNARKPLIVVVNDSLMHNHQAELATQLKIDKHCDSCLPGGVLEVLQNLNEQELVPFKPGEPKLFVDHLNAHLGLT